MSPAASLLDVESLGVKEQGRSILEQISFQARAGEVTAIIGPNGAGKTTLLEALAGLRRVDSGQVRLDGRPLGRFAERARRLSFLPDAGALPPETTVRTVVRHARSLASVPTSLDGILARLGVDRLGQKPVALLSRGEHQRVALHCTLALGRTIVLLDEPFGAFDPVQLREVLGVVRDVARAGAAMLASVHQLADAEKIADRVLLLSAGRQIAFADPATLRAEAGGSPASLEEAFIALLSKAGHAA